MALLWRSALLVTLAVLLSAPAQAAFDASDATERLLAAPPVGFEDTVALSGLEQPTAVRFAPDGRIFVAEKAGRIQVFDDFGDPTPTLYADLSREVHDFWDRGLLGMELDPGFATGRPYVYVLYAYDKDPNSPAFPRWGDECPSPPGAMEDGCVVTGRLSRLSGGFEQVLIEDWCQQYSSHSLGSLAFGADGALYVSAGEGANYNIADWGQDGIPRNPCGDPPAVVGGAQTPPSAEGGALRAQDVLTPGDPTGLGGTVLRVDPDTGNPRPDNPGTGDANARRIVAYGLRNPFRIATRPGTNEVWVGEVGWHDWEEIDRVPNPAAAVRNFGWPCYEGTGRMESYDAIDLNVCETLYSAGPSAHAAPYYTYNHQSRVVAGESCGVGSSSISGLAFTPPDSSFPPAYDGALFFADYSRDCIWAMLRGADGLPDPANIQTFVAGAENPVELQFGPNGDLYYVDLENGRVRRVRSVTTNHAPVARARADRTSGDVPLTVSFDGSASTDPDGQAIGYAWDLDGDGAFDDSTAVKPDLHVHGRRHLHGPPAGHRSRRAVRHLQRADRRRPAAGPGHHHHVAGAEHDLEGRRHHPLQRLGDRRLRRPDPGRRPDVGDPPPPLRPGERVLPHAHAAELRRRGERLVPGARPRVPVVPGDRAHGTRRARAVRDRHPPARPPDRRADAGEPARRARGSRSAARPRPRRSLAA